MKKNYIFKIDLKKLNVFCILLYVVLFIFTYLIFPDSLDGIWKLFDDLKFCILFLPLTIFYSILHELLHAVGYIVNGADYKKITFGMELEKGVFYCLCKQDITKRNILTSLMFPLFFIGIVTYIISIIFNLPILLLLSIINIGGCIGDIMYFIFISKLPNDVMFSELDDGTSFAIVSKQNPKKYNHFGLIYIGKQDTLSRKDFKRLKISKLSWFLLVIGILALLVGIFL